MISKLKFIIDYTTKYKWWYISGIASLIITIWTSVAIPEYIRKVIDLVQASSSPQPDLLRKYVIIMITLALVLIVVRSLSRIFIFIPARLIERNIKGQMFKKLSTFEKEYFDKNSTGAIISRINNDINGVRLITGFGILQTFNIILSLSITPYMMYKLSPSLTLYCIIPIIIIFTIVRFGMKVMVKYTHKQMASTQSLSGKVISFLSGNSVIKSYNIYDYAEGELEKENQDVFKHSLKINWIRSFVMPLLFNLAQILKVLILLVGGLYVISSNLTIGELTAYIAYSALLAQPIMGLGWVLTIFQQGMVGIDSIQTILSHPSKDEKLLKLSPIEHSSLFKDGIELKNLNYTFHDGESPTLNNISFKIEPGSIIGITGVVGSGKTTLINCINGYLRPEEKMIFFGKHDASKLCSSEIRSVVRTVSQEAFLFSDTIENNVLFGSENSLRNSFEETIFRAALQDELKRFKDERKTLVGEKGIMLSGGQKQRLSLARALYTPCDLLILDDVFSAVDTDTEQFLIKQIIENNHAKSLLIVSNRISVLQKTNYNLVLENGCITAQGSHSELMKKSDYYREIAQLQTEK